MNCNRATFTLPDELRSTNRSELNSMIQWACRLLSIAGGFAVHPAIRIHFKRLQIALQWPTKLIAEFKPEKLG